MASNERKEEIFPNIRLRKEATSALRAALEADSPHAEVQNELRRLYYKLLGPAAEEELRALAEREKEKKGKDRDGEKERKKEEKRLREEGRRKDADGKNVDIMKRAQVLGAKLIKDRGGARQCLVRPLEHTGSSETVYKMFLEWWSGEFTMEDLFFLTEVNPSVFSPLTQSRGDDVTESFHYVVIPELQGEALYTLSSSEGVGDPNNAEVAGLSISSYPMMNKEHGVRAGDPICDHYEAIVYEKRHIFGVADGCNWGNAPRQAAQRCSREAVKFLDERQVCCGFGCRDRKTWISIHI